MSGVVRPVPIGACYPHIARLYYENFEALVVADFYFTRGQLVRRVIAGYMLQNIAEMGL